MNNAENNRDELVNTQQAAEILGIKASTLMVWRSTGRYELSFVKCGRMVRYKVSDLQRFIERRTFKHT